MTRKIAIACLVLCCGVLSLTVILLINTLTGNLRQAKQVQPAGDPRPAQITLASAQTIAGSALPILPVFGTASLPKTATQDVVAPTITAPSFTHTLRGIVASGTMRWAVLSGPSGEIVVREGDAVGALAKVDRIAADHVFITLGDTSLTLRFAQPVAPAIVQQYPVPDPHQTARTPGAPAPVLAMVRSVEMSREEVDTLVRAAKVARLAPVSP